VEPPISVGLRVPAPVFPRGAQAVADFVAAAEDAGLDRLCIGDHVTFQGGQGFDALINATTLAVLSRRVQVETAIYLLPLRHPVPVARQVVSIAELAPGRFRFGVGIGGEDPHEVLACGVDPATRGRRMDEALPLVRGLLRGESVTGTGPHFPVEQVCFRSTAASDVPILVGGRSPAALRRAGRYGDGWLGLWVTPERFRESCTDITAAAAPAGRNQVHWQHAMHVWCGFDDDADVARDRLAAAMEGLYRTPYEKFARYSPAGRPADVAAFLRDYVDAGCRSFNLLAVAGDDRAAIEGARTVRTLLEDNT
jgi:alkanesulfonate monooxygenase SsuD/methylene tetrahydromethanopterin reductase-like flavin-dependent oxidoreductase (luciferase family)